MEETLPLTRSIKRDCSPDSSSVGEGGGVFSRSRSDPSLLVLFLLFFLEN